MLKSIVEFSYFLGVDPKWMFLDIILLLLLMVVKCIYPWQPKWKSKTTIDKDGNKVTKYYHLDE